MPTLTILKQESKNLNSTHQHYSWKIAIIIRGMWTNTATKKGKCVAKSGHQEATRLIKGRVIW